MALSWTRGGGLSGLIWPLEKRSSACEIESLCKAPLKSKSKSKSKSSLEKGVVKKEGVDGAVMKGEVEALSKLNSGAGEGDITSISMLHKWNQCGKRMGDFSERFIEREGGGEGGVRAAF